MVAAYPPRRQSAHSWVALGLACMLVSIGLATIRAQPALAESRVLNIDTHAAGALCGEAFTTQPVLEVLGDNSGSPYSGVPVTASIGGGATLQGDTVVNTGSDGLATFTDLAVIAAAGTYTLSFRIQALTGFITKNQTITVTPGAGVGLAVTTAPGGAVSGVAFTTQPVISIVDSGGNVAATNRSHLITAASSGGTLAGNTKSPSAGIATFTTLRLTGTSGTTYTLTFTASTFTPVTATITLGYVPAKLVVVTPPAGSVSGLAFTTQPTVAIQEADGTQVLTSTATVTASVTHGGTLIGSASATAVAGLATFTDLGLKAPTDVPYTITFSSGGLTSAAVTITPGSGSGVALVVNRPASGAASGSPFATQPRILILDAHGYVARSSTATVTAMASFGALTGTSTVVAKDGEATFTDLGIIGPVGSYTITYVARDLPSAAQILTVGPANPAATAVSTGSGTAGTSPPTVTGVVPNVGLAVGGQVVTITGTNFVGGVTVRFGDTPSSDIAVTSATSITARTPTGTDGAVKVSVTTPGGTASLENGYAYLPTGASLGPGVFMATTSGAQVAGRVTARQKAGNAGVIRAALHTPIQVQVGGLPTGRRFTASIAIGESWRRMGTVVSDARGQGSISSLALTVPGTYRILLKHGRQKYFVGLQASG